MRNVHIADLSSFGGAPGPATADGIYFGVVAEIIGELAARGAGSARIAARGAHRQCRRNRLWGRSHRRDGFDRGDSGRVELGHSGKATVFLPNRQ